MPSSGVSAFTYNSSNNTLRITFVSGMMYDYKNVPEEVYQAMKVSGAKRTYLNKHIKGRYTFEKLKE
ncbi:MAG: KTSC domain-containing protein [Ginsengibacter sp.]